ncbi:hypothetical protein [Oceanobacillus profundus]|uniref:Uncharacterized protein n=1 Tax=Oceanobacillus profundus TaxID=372463 RepID=A0A417YGI9_9BACI|nr:hypothetical protein [Oceanobacillus profundus]RHW31938.1 hypothetical protein D1B32_11915 [Oceanobacillus profundus]
MEVEFVTLGNASKIIDTPAPTLRGWADKLEELQVHYLERNHRDERIFYESDIKIFRYMAEQKSKYNRKTTTTDIAYVIAENDKFELRQKGSVPAVPKHKAQLSEIDLEHLVQQRDFQEFIGGIIQRATDGLSEEISEKVSNNMRVELNNKLDDIEERRIKRMDQYLAEQRETQKMIEEYLKLPAYKKIFSKNPMKNTKK